MSDRPLRCKGRFFTPLRVFLEEEEYIVRQYRQGGQDE